MIQGLQVGPVASSISLAQGTQPNLRGGQLGDLIVSELQPRFYEQAYRRTRFQSANQAGLVTSVGLTTTYLGLVLSNPLGSGYTVVPDIVGWAFPVAPAAAITFGLQCGYSATANVTHTATAVVHSAFIGIGMPGVGLVDTSATTTGTPWIHKILGKCDTGALTVDSQVAGIFDLAGSLILPPGAWMGFYTSTASNTAGFLGSIEWTEVPV